MTVGTVVTVTTALRVVGLATAAMMIAITVNLVAMVVIPIIIMIVVAPAIGRVATRNFNTRNGAQRQSGAPQNLKEDRFHGFNNNKECMSNQGQM